MRPKATGNQATLETRQEMYRPHLVPLPFPLLGLCLKVVPLLLLTGSLTRKVPGVRHVTNSMKNLKQIGFKLSWYIIFVRSTRTSFIFLFIPYIIPWYASDFVLMPCFGSYSHFPAGGFLMSGMLMALTVIVGTAPWGVSRTLGYCALSPSFGRCLGYPVRSLEDLVPLSLHGPRPFRHLHLTYFT